MSWGIAGSSPFSDLQKSEHVLVKELLEAQWSLTGALSKSESSPAGVRFGTGWGNAVINAFEVHCLSIPSAPPRPLNVGWTIYEYRPKVAIHIFARRITNIEPQDLGQLQREVDRILARFKTAIAGIIITSPSAWRSAHDPEDAGSVTYWHQVGECELLYWKVAT